MLLPLDPLPDALPPKAAQIVSEFQYVGIKVNVRPRDYIPLNVIPLLGKVAEKVDSWCRLPLTVIGRSNLNKIILMTQILYIMHNSPVWVPMYLIHRFHHLLCALIGN